MEEPAGFSTASAKSVWGKGSSIKGRLKTAMEAVKQRATLEGEVAKELAKRNEGLKVCSAMYRNRCSQTAP